jgi:hypothetical protein
VAYRLDDICELRQLMLKHQFFNWLFVDWFVSRGWIINAFLSKLISDEGKVYRENGNTEIHSDESFFVASMLNSFS